MTSQFFTHIRLEDVLEDKIKSGLVTLENFKIYLTHREFSQHNLELYEDVMKYRKMFSEYENQHVKNKESKMKSAWEIHRARQMGKSITDLASSRSSSVTSHKHNQEKPHTPTPPPNPKLHHSLLKSKLNQSQIMEQVHPLKGQQSQSMTTTGQRVLHKSDSSGGISTSHSESSTPSFEANGSKTLITPHSLHSFLLGLINTYIVQSSPCEINIDEKQRTELIAMVKDQMYVYPDVLKPVLNSIMQVLRYQSFPNFLKECYKAISWELTVWKQLPEMEKYGDRIPFIELLKQIKSGV